MDQKGLCLSVHLYISRQITPSSKFAAYLYWSVVRYTCPSKIINSMASPRASRVRLQRGERSLEVQLHQITTLNLTRMFQACFYFVPLFRSGTYMLFHIYTGKRWLSVAEGGSGGNCLPPTGRREFWPARPNPVLYADSGGAVGGPCLSIPQCFTQHRCSFSDDIEYPHGFIVSGASCIGLQWYPSSTVSFSVGPASTPFV